MALHDLLPFLRQQEPYKRLLDAVRTRRHPSVVGPAGAEKAYLLAALAEDLLVPGPRAADPEQRRGAVLLVTPSQDAAERLHDDLLTFAPTLEGAVTIFPQWDLLRLDGERPAPQIVVSSASGMWRASKTASSGCTTGVPPQPTIPGMVSTARRVSPPLT